MLKRIYILLFLISTIFSKAQGTSAEMADTFRQEGKIYVVIGVLSIVFICIVLILFWLERKLSKLEKEVKESKN